MPVKYLIKYDTYSKICYRETTQYSVYMENCQMLQIIKRETSESEQIQKERNLALENAYI